MLLPSLAWAGFKGGPSVRVSPNDRIEIRWRADFQGFGRVAVFDDPAGSPDHLIDLVGSSSTAIDHTIVLYVGGLIRPDTTYYFKVTHIDASGVRPDLTNEPAPLPSFFTGAQPPGAGEPDRPKLTVPNGAIGLTNVALGLSKGMSVAISGDTVVVGAPATDSIEEAVGFREGAAHVFVKPQSGWTTTHTFAAMLVASDANQFARFGSALAIDGDTVVVMAPHSCTADVFVKPASGWSGTLNETAKLAAADGVCLGTSVAIDGDTIVVGVETDNIHKGSVYVFVKPIGGWAGTVIDTAKLTAFDSEPAVGKDGDNFGHSVGISGATIVVGAHQDRDGDSILRGSAYVFVKPASGWTSTSTFEAKLAASDGHSFDYFGASVAISGDTLVVGAPWSARGAYVFVEPAAGWAGNLLESAKLTSTDQPYIDPFDFFGSSVAISGDDVLIGALGAEGAKGAAYLFSKPAAGWAGPLNESVKLTASDGKSFDVLGSSVAITSDTLVVGADEWVNFEASAYVISKTTAPPTYQPPGTICLGAPGHQILAPINADGSSVFRQKSTVPAKFRVCDANGVSVGTAGVVTSFDLIQVITGTTTSDVNETVPSTTPHTAFRWDSAEQLWIFNIGTEKMSANATYVYRISLDDGTHIDFRYGLR